jgi:hypothetical protein
VHCCDCHPHCARRLLALTHNGGQLSLSQPSQQIHPQNSRYLQGVPPSSCGRRAAVWSGACRTGHQVHRAGGRAWLSRALQRSSWCSLTTSCVGACSLRLLPLPSLASRRCLTRPPFPLEMFGSACSELTLVVGMGAAPCRKVMNAGTPYNFWAYFPDGSIMGQRGWSMSWHGCADRRFLPLRS